MRENGEFAIKQQQIMNCESIGETRRHNMDSMENAQQQTVQKQLGHEVPILYSTNRGLHLRVVKKQNWSELEQQEEAYKTATTANCTLRQSYSDATGIYDISFCDLERWSTNRAHTISLEDTFTVTRRRTPLLFSNMQQQQSGNSREHSAFARCHVPPPRSHCPFMNFDA